jgi:hypothetical protein
MADHSVPTSDDAWMIDGRSLSSERMEDDAVPWIQCLYYIQKMKKLPT